MRIEKQETVGLIIDIQEKLFPHISENDAIRDHCAILIKGLKILEIPVLLTEQYTKGLGPTISALQPLLKETEAIEKLSFSCCGIETFNMKLKNLRKRNVVIAGIEAHVCVLQTTLDLLERGFQPVVVENAVGSRNNEDKRIAMERMRTAGAVITSYESILFELCKVAGSDQFKSISNLVK